jgi:hypothetical protein
MNDHFHKGFRQADRVAEKEPHLVAYWLDRARRGRRRWRTRLLDWKKRRFLDGFIARLESFEVPDGEAPPVGTVGSDPPLIEFPGTDPDAATTAASPRSDDRPAAGA